MRLKKTNESINRTFNSEGVSEDRVESMNFDVYDGENNVIGNASVGKGHCRLEINIYEFTSASEGEAKLKEALGIE